MTDDGVRRFFSVLKATGGAWASEISWILQRFMDFPPLHLSSAQTEGVLPTEKTKARPNAAYIRIMLVFEQELRSLFWFFGTIMLVFTHQFYIHRSAQFFFRPFYFCIPVFWYFKSILNLVYQRSQRCYTEKAIFARDCSTEALIGLFVLVPFGTYFFPQSDTDTLEWICFA